MNGKRALFPLGYHCTGMPIKACADKLVREIELFGQNFENNPDEQVDGEDAEPDELPAPVESDTKTDITQHRAKKSKAKAKTGKAKFQYQIMEQLGIPKSEIHKFADASYWLQYFPPLAKRDLISFGARIDWRRQFVTTDANPYYDSFVKWQVTRLKEMGHIDMGKRYAIYSPRDGQPCMDHDRQSGEGVLPQQYTALKLRVKSWPEKTLKVLPENLKTVDVYFVPATLRPETMYGQVACYVSKTITYGIYQFGNEFYFLTERAARNIAFQRSAPGSADWGVYKKVAELKGEDVIGTLVNAPLSVHTGGVRILPMETVKETKGTGVVTSVPSDSPDE